MTAQENLYRVEETGVCPDNSVIFLSPNSMVKLTAKELDVVLLRNKNKYTCGVVKSDQTMGDMEIKLNKTLRLNASLKLSDNVYPVVFSDIRIAKSVNILPFTDTISENVHIDLITHLLEPYFKNKFRPIKKGDQFVCNMNMLSVEFRVIDITFEQNSKKNINANSPIRQNEYESCCIVGPDTEIKIAGDPLPRNKDDDTVKKISYEDIGGCKNVIKQLREICELPIKFPEVFKTLGTKPPKGVLFHGPPGTGKTLLAKAIANECGCYFVNVNAPEIVAAQPGASEKMLKSIFEDAQENKPAIIFIDEIDSITQKRDKINSELEKRIVAQLLILMDGLAERGQVIVIGATNRPNTMDPALRRCGRFDKEINIGVPDTEGREEIFKIHTKSMKL
jgi:transitional endoplasmic reticulum ATPase